MTRGKGEEHGEVRDGGCGALRARQGAGSMREAAMQRRVAAELRDEADCRGLPMHGAGAPDGCARGRAMNPRHRHDTARVAKRGHDRGRQPSEPKPACGELRRTATRRRICIRRAVAGRANRPRGYGSTVAPARGRTLERQGRLRKQGKASTGLGIQAVIAFHPVGENGNLPI